MKIIFDGLIPGEGKPLSRVEERERERSLHATRLRLGEFNRSNQFLGLRSPIGCVSLEISQRCNLDCTLCYLSENSQSVLDLPLPELFRRLEEIRATFGVNTNVQISGGEPTLRKRAELVQLVRYARRLGLNTALFTNGIACSRELLIELSENGLSDVAFHVDMTQQRPGYSTESDLNALRLEYIERARGLPLMVIFNTTVFGENYQDVPALTRFFVEHADVVGWASFQLQADTGRGELRERPEAISLETMRQKISDGAGSALPWDAILIGHPKCHGYAPALAIGSKAYGLPIDAELVGEFFQRFGHLHHDRRQSAGAIAWSYAKAMAGHPGWFLRTLSRVLRNLWAWRKPLWTARGRVRPISFFVQNFMHEDHLDPERIEACSFMVMTPDGPMSMCAHNARRDEFILRPLNIESAEGVIRYTPLPDKKNIQHSGAKKETIPFS